MLVTRESLTNTRIYRCQKIRFYCEEKHGISAPAGSIFDYSLRSAQRVPSVEERTKNKQRQGDRDMTIRIVGLMALALIFFANTALAERRSTAKRSMQYQYYEMQEPQLDLDLKVETPTYELIEVKDCEVQNDGSTWCDYYDCDKDGVCILLTHGCFSDWDGQDCDGNEVED